MGPDLVARLRAIVGDAGILTDPADVEPHVIDWRRRNRGRTIAVVRPASTAEVAAVVGLCAETRTPICPQGGNTGQCAAAIPSEDGGQVVIALGRMNRIRGRDAVNSTMEVEAGCILANLQQAALEMDRIFPLSLGAEGSCQIGGNLATNAGGTAVLRYGNARELVLGLEVVLPDGTIWNGLKALRKDNTGYDLKQLFVGAEGTLGIITAAVIKLFPKPRAGATALAAVVSPAAAIELLGMFRSACGDRLTGFELISRRCLDLLFRNVPRFTDPLPDRHDWYVLGELNDTLASADLKGAMEAALCDAVGRGLVLDATIAASDTQARTLWQMREEIPEGLRRECPWVRHDVSVPVSRVAEFIERGSAALAARFPGVRIVAFGHLGDGNIHFNASQPDGMTAEAFAARSHDVYETVHDLVAELNGSFSAEHGIGLIKRAEMRRYKSPVALDLMARIKHAIDPHGLMNPGKVL
jgi:FAD/FMN-containing dehydrogenase